MTNLQAAVGLGQMESLESFIAIKERNYHLYNDCGIELMRFREDIRPNYWFYSYITEYKDELIKHLNEDRIQTRPIWNLICDLKPYARCMRYKINKAREYWNKVVNIPCSTNLSEEDVNRVIKEIKSFERITDGY